MSDPVVFPLDEILGCLVVRVAHAVEHGFTELMAQEGITVRQFGILAIVARDEGLPAAAIARRLDVTAQSVGGQIDTLCRRRLLTRDPDPGPGRPIGVRTTAGGLEVLRRSARLAVDYEEQTMGHLDADARGHLADVLREILDRA